MNQNLETLIKAVGVIVGVLFGTGTFAWPTDATILNTLTTAVSVVLVVGLDVWSTYRLRKQGIVSTNPQANVVAPGSPVELAKKERGDA